MKDNRFGTYTAISVVVANMIGTGVFTSLGFQIADIKSVFVLLMLWVVGGVTALCGALTYAELGAALPRSGGEYNFLSRIYHPGAGFISGFVSASIGFAAPIALAALTFGSYLASAVPVLPPVWLATGLILVLTAVHARTHASSGLLQRSFTTLKVALILLFCLAALALVDAPQFTSLVPATGELSGMVSRAFAVSLIYVSYAYTGWNAATYITSELKDPQRTLPRVLAAGTGIVMVAYVALNFAFLYAAPMAELEGRIEIGYIAATHMVGPAGADLMGITLALLLISTVSAMILAGPRVLQVIGQDYRVFRPLSRTNDDDIPATAIWSMGIVSIVFVLTASFESILVFAGFTLGLNTFFTVAGVYVLRWRQPALPRPYRTWGYPVTPAIFLLLTGWTLVYLMVERPQEVAFGLAVVGAGLLLYLASAWWERRPR